MFEQYDPGQVIIQLGGRILTGFAAGTFITAERNEDSFSEVVGSDGLVTRVFSRNKSGIVTLTLQGASPSNDLLAAQHAADELTRTGFANLSVTDLNGTTRVNAPIAWVRKPANYEAADSESSREWVLACAQLFMHVGGGNLSL